MDLLEMIYIYIYIHIRKHWVMFSGDMYPCFSWLLNVAQKIGHFFNPVLVQASFLALNFQVCLNLNVSLQNPNFHGC